MTMLYFKKVTILNKTFMYAKDDLAKEDKGIGSNSINDGTVILPQTMFETDLNLYPFDEVVGNLFKFNGVWLPITRTIKGKGTYCALVELVQTEYDNSNSEIIPIIIFKGIIKQLKVIRGDKDVKLLTSYAGKQLLITYNPR